MRSRRRSVRLFGLRPTALAELYWWRLSDQKAQELLAALGIAIGVALFFGVTVADTSLTGSAAQLISATEGSARIQVTSRSAQGFSEQIATRARELPGVEVVAPILRQDVQLVGPKGRRPIQLIGVTGHQIALNGSVTRDLGAGVGLIAGGLGLPSGVATATGATPGGQVTILAGGTAVPVRVRAVLGSETVGAIAHSPLVVALLGKAQIWTGQDGLVTELLIKSKPGATAAIERELGHLTAGRLNIQPASHELEVLNATAKPTKESTGLFAAISAMVGFLLSLNAMLLTVPARRRFAAELRHLGFGPRQIILVLLSQAAMLGLVASVVGVALGTALSSVLFHEIPSYLTFAFPIGTRTVVSATAVLLAIAGGLLAAVVASLVPVMDFACFRANAEAPLGEAGQSVGRRATVTAGVFGALLVAVTTFLVLLVPSVSVLGGVLLAAAAFFLIFPIFVMVLRGLKPLGERRKKSMVALAVFELDGTATRSIALAGIVAVVVYGLVAIQGARHDLSRGLNQAVVQFLNTADIWVTTDDNFLTVDRFKDGGATTAISQSPGIASVREFQSSLLDEGDRRLWIRARPAADITLIQASQLLHGDLARATALIRAGGWAAVSDGFAKERRLRVGSDFSLLSPSGRAPLRVAAITTNVGWPPGAITMNEADYQRYWLDPDPTALEVNLKPGITAAQGKRIVQTALGDRRGLLVQTFHERQLSYEASARQGIASLGRIATLLLITTALAIAAALSAGIWQRRTRLASLSCDGFDARQLWRALMLEASILIAIGCLDGASLGLFGHVLASRWLRISIGFPAPFSLGIGSLFLTIVLITCIAMLVVSLPGLLAARTEAALSFEETG